MGTASMWGLQQEIKKIQQEMKKEDLSVSEREILQLRLVEVESNLRLEVEGWSVREEKRHASE